MKINNFVNQINTIILYGANLETTKEINPYNTKAFFTTKNIFNEDTESYDDYFKIIIENLIECKNIPTHINKQKKNDNIFVVWVRGKYGDINGALYIPFSKVILHDVIEEKKDLRGDGCINVSYNDKIIFNNEIKIICKDSEIYFAKPTDQIKNQYEKIIDIDECIAKETERAQKYPNVFHNCERLIELYKSKKEQGYKYRVFNYRAIEKNYNYVMFYNCVDHYEKSTEYTKAEKLTEEIKKINNKWDVDDTIKLLKSFKLTKKRK